MRKLTDKIILLPVIIVIGMLLAAVYGCVHDQITYAISHEYYTKFKFYQFGTMSESGQQPEHVHWAVAKVGVLATWWVGGFVGIVVGLTTLICKTRKDMLRQSLAAFAITFITAITSGVAGYLYGRNVLSGQDSSNLRGWYIPEGLDDFDSFITVGSIHNFSYLGGVLGMLISVVFIIVKKIRKSKRPTVE